MEDLKIFRGVKFSSTSWKLWRSCNEKEKKAAQFNNTLLENNSTTQDSHLDNNKQVYKRQKLLKKQTPATSS